MRRYGQPPGRLGCDACVGGTERRGLGLQRSGCNVCAGVGVCDLDAAMQRDMVSWAAMCTIGE